MIFYVNTHLSVGKLCHRLINERKSKIECSKSGVKLQPSMKLVLLLYAQMNITFSSSIFVSLSLNFNPYVEETSIVVI